MIICKICFDRMKEIQEYYLDKNAKFTILVCEDCKREHILSCRPIIMKKDQHKLFKLYYEGDTEKMKLFYGEDA